jgi:hypothetical protein
MPVSEFIDNEIEKRGNSGVPTSDVNKNLLHEASTSHSD